MLTLYMIKLFKHKALADLFQTGKTGKIDAKMHKRILVRLDRLEVSERPEDMDLPGFDFHHLRGFTPTRYTVHVNGPWCITFEFDANDAARVDFELYH
jgi:toxin HigB-1